MQCWDGTQGSYVQGTLKYSYTLKKQTTTAKHPEEGENQHVSLRNSTLNERVSSPYSVLTCWQKLNTLLLSLHPWSALHDWSQALPWHKASFAHSRLLCGLLLSNPISLEILLRYYVIRCHHCSLLHWRWPCSLNEPWNSLTIRSLWHASDPSWELLHQIGNTVGPWCLWGSWFWDLE